VALAAILTVAGEHMFASQETDALKRNRLNLIFVLATLILVFAAYAIGEAS
jgi:MFS superfamily sulfate permease-like transporter